MRNPFKKVATLTGRVIKEWEHNSWGDNLHWFDYDRLMLVGWLYRKPTVNDEIQVKMRNAERGEVVTRYIVTDVEHAEGVRDMFFATVKPFAYVGEPITDKYVREVKK